VTVEDLEEEIENLGEMLSVAAHGQSCILLGIQDYREEEHIYSKRSVELGGHWARPCDASVGGGGGGVV
jgi:hypothetical protein